MLPKSVVIIPVSITPAQTIFSFITAIYARGTPSDDPLWWSVVFGSNLGGNLTPIGSASTLVAVTIIHKYGLPLSFAAFVKAALPFAVLHIVAATVYLLVFLA